MTNNFEKPDLYTDVPLTTSGDGLDFAGAMKKLTKEWFKQHDACKDGYEWTLTRKDESAEYTLNELIRLEKYDWANWTICRIFNRKQKMQYAIFTAEQVIDIFEKKYPDDKRPREAIEAARKVLKNDTAENRLASAATAAYYYADKEMQNKILKYGFKLLKIKYEN